MTSKNLTYGDLACVDDLYVDPLEGELVADPEETPGSCTGCALKDSRGCATAPDCNGVIFVHSPRNPKSTAPVVTPVQESKSGGRKDDSGKLDVTLFFDDLPFAIEAVTEVLQWAVTKKGPVPYERGSWQGVDDFQRRYRAAMLRHTLDGAKEGKVAGTPFEETTDHETGLLQLAHIATDAMFQLERAVRKLKGIA